jgi:hypothetical protein
MAKAARDHHLGGLVHAPWARVGALFEIRDAPRPLDDLLRSLLLVAVVGVFVRFRPKNPGVGERGVGANQMIPWVHVTVTEAVNETAHVG